MIARQYIAVMASAALLSGCGNINRPSLSMEEMDKIRQATADAPESSKHVLYTEDQRLAMAQYAAAYMLREPSFVGSAEKGFENVAARTSATALLENVPAYPACFKWQWEEYTADVLQSRIPMAVVYQYAALDISKRYSDAQIAELYRIAQIRGKRQDISDSLFSHSACSQGCDTRPFMNPNGPSTWAENAISADVAQHRDEITAQIMAIGDRLRTNPGLSDPDIACGADRKGSSTIKLVPLKSVESDFSYMPNYPKLEIPKNPASLPVSAQNNTDLYLYNLQRQKDAGASFTERMILNTILPAPTADEVRAIKIHEETSSAYKSSHSVPTVNPASLPKFDPTPRSITP